MKPVAAAAGLIAALLGCALAGPAVAQAPSTSEAPRRVVFLCDRGVSITVSFDGGTASLSAGGQVARLERQTVASGIHYKGEGHELRGAGPEITWTGPDSVARNCRDQEWAMRQPQIQEPIMGLAGTSWTLVHFQSSDDSIGKIVPPNVERYTLRFGADGSANLQLDCNRAMARWEAKPSSASGGALTMTAGAMTRAMCGPGAMDTRIARDLTSMRSYTLTGGRLAIALEADAGIYLWAPAPGGR
jgi:heat shock protein HslJ